eukprot:TRINITY_DN38290_c0_g1_i1.p1 TRINITY_DN38290_c0_g1~~TRINITY_DN38290_c0_g1_i1.p1  ORF type:complete len:194 (+),score=37.53 TRINITY_DN38290_c0_g1_i1:111-692(+)
MGGELEIILIVVLVNAALAMCCVALYVHYLVRKKRKYADQSGIPKTVEGMWRGGDQIHLFKIEHFEGYFMWKHCDEAGEDVRGQLERADDRFGEKYPYYCKLSNGCRVYLQQPQDNDQLMIIKLVRSDNKTTVDIDARRWVTELENSSISDASSRHLQDHPSYSSSMALNASPQQHKERSFVGVPDGWQPSHA